MSSVGNIGASNVARRNSVRPKSSATFGRSVELFKAFRLEQSDPDVFYSTLALDAVDQVGEFAGLDGALVLDVGGGPGYFADAFTSRGASYIPMDADAGEMRLHGRTPAPNTVMGDGTALPIGTGTIDICYSSNVAEHVARPWQMADEMVRVTKQDGLIFLSYTLWYGPWGGHETSPWHYCGGKWAAARYERKFGRAPKNFYGESLFPITAGAGLRWARGQGDAQVLAAYPRYLPSWSWQVAMLPGVRELALWNLMIVLRKR